jgi:hypothetical protein
MTRMQMSARAARLIGLMVMVAAVGFAVAVLAREGGALLKESIRLNPLAVAASCAVVWAGMLLAVVLWRRIAIGFGIRQPAATDLRFYAYSALGVVLPGSIWPLVGRAVLYQRVGESPLSVTAATVVEACITGAAAMAVYAVGVMLQPNSGLLAQPVLGVVAAVAALVMISPPVFNRLSNALLRRAGQPVGAVPIRLHAGELLIWWMIACLVILIAGVALYLLLNSLVDAPLELLGRLIVAWAAATVVGSLLFWMPATSLLRDGALVLALTPALGAAAILFAVLARVWSIATLLLFAAVIWLWFDSPPARRIRRSGLINP